MGVMEEMWTARVRGAALLIATAAALPASASAQALPDAQCLAMRQPNTSEQIERMGRILRPGSEIPAAVPDASFWPQDGTSAKRHTGRVEVTYTLQLSGRADHCRVVVSSGFADLDAQSCLLVETRLVLDPRQKNGMRTSTIGRIAVAWLPELNPNAEFKGCTDGGGAIPVSPRKWRPAGLRPVRPHDENVLVRIAVSWAGVPKGCDVVASQVDAQTSAQVCRAILAHGWFLPKADDHGNLLDTTATMVLPLQGATSYRKYPPR